MFSRLVKVDVASHSPQMAGPASALQAELNDVAPSADQLPIMSTVLARRAAGREFDASYWGQNMRQPVRFAESVSLLLEQGATVFVELSPHPILTQAIQETAQACGRDAIVTIECGRRETPEQTDRAVGRRTLVDRWGPCSTGRGSLRPRRTSNCRLYPWQREKTLGAPSGATLAGKTWCLD